MADCTQCGKCCLVYGGDGKNGGASGLGMASDADLKRWENRPDIMAWVPCSLVPDLWISPVTGEEAARCPWLRKLPNQNRYKCRIHDVRPDVCRGYPYNIEQMIQDACEMLDG